MNLCTKAKRLRCNLFNVFRFSTTLETVGKSDEFVVDDADDIRVREEEINQKRNISRLSTAHFNLVNGRRPYDTPKSLAHLTVKYHRKLYGKYGIASGVNPSLCWPSKRDLQEKIEYESVAFPYTIKEMMETALERRRQQNYAIEARERELAVKYAKLDQWKKELIEKINKKNAETAAAKEKKDRLVEEVRRYFGYKLDPRDERFKEMLAKREKEQKKIEKQARKDAKEKMMLAKLQQKNVEINKQLEN